MSTANLLSNRYELGDTLGYGGMSEVHHGHDVRLGREVAVKILRADLARDKVFQERFRREAQNSAALNHPAIVAVYDTGETTSEYGPLPYIVMEYVEGRTLRDIVKTEGPMDQKRAMEVMADVCAALDFSHRHGIIHRDVKPANVMISKTGAVKVMDFGIARAIHDGQAAMTQTAAVIGTAQYLSPEQARGESVDARSDVYAAGCVLYELITGEPPFTGDSPVAVAYQHVREDAQPPSSVNPAVSPELDAVVLKALTKGPANRYQSAAEMRSDLVRVLSHQRPSAPMVMTEDDRTQVIGATRRQGYEPVYDPDAEEEERQRGRRRMFVALGIIGALLLGLLLWLGGVFDSGEQAVAIPNVMGQEHNQAAAKLREEGFSDVEEKAVKCIPTEYGGEAPCEEQDAQKVFAMDPQHGSKVATSTKITLSYGVLPKELTMPTVTDMKVDAAIKRLEEKGLLVNPKRETVENDDPKKAGKVAEQDPPAGEQVFEGDGVTLKVYGKPEMVEITDYTGKTQQEAEAGLRALGFEVDVQEVDSDQEEGIVVKQTPNKGEVVKGETVVLEVSNGTGAEIEMPDVIDDTEEQARQALEEAGHKGDIEIRDEPTIDPAQDGRVAASDPAEGEPMKASDKVTLVVYRLDGGDEGGDGGGDGGNGGDNCPPDCFPGPGRSRF